MAKSSITYNEILNDIVRKQFKPVYFFMGEEPYYIDLLTDAIIKHALTESERDFNQTIFYGADTNISAVINAAKRYPVMAERQLIVVKESQTLKNIDDLSYYLQKPQPTTILVFNHKYGKLDGRKKVSIDIDKTGVLFESKKLYDNQIPAWISSYITSKGYSVDGKAAAMLSEFLGTNLSRIASESDKLIITLPPGEKRITPESVERNIGISKEYNSFELQKALAEKNALKVNRIIAYFADNPRSDSVIKVMGILFSFFSNLMICHYAVDKSENGIMKELGFRFGIQTNDYRTALRNYNAVKTMQAVSLFREYDAKLKGFQSVSISDANLLKELMFKVMH